tara:strand:- start:2533 stop:3195 length:663 start_codon:yes stop_codon:yes gene_type:complete
MIQNKSISLFKNIQNFVLGNFRVIVIILFVFIFLFIGYQFYNYFKVQEIKKSSINFFNAVQQNNNELVDLQNLIDKNNIFSVLSKLKLIQKNNENKNFSYSNKLYNELIFSSNLDNLYKSSIAANASYTLINASYEENTTTYFNDISIYIKNISDDLDNYFSIKKELEYLLIITKIDINKSEYKNNSNALNKYNEIFNSSLVSPSIKERVKKIHEFQLYN